MAKRTRKVKKVKKAGARKPTKRKAVKKKVARKKKTKKVSKQKLAPKLPAEPIGRVTHYFPHVKATAILVERDEIKLGDTLFFKGHTTQFKQRVDSLQIDHQPVNQASPGQEIGIQVKSRTREHDLVFKL